MHKIDNKKVYSKKETLNRQRLNNERIGTETAIKIGDKIIERLSERRIIKCQDTQGEN